MRKFSSMRYKNCQKCLFVPIDTQERRNGWYVCAFSLNIENMNCDIGEFVRAVAAEGAPCWKVFWPQCHTERAFTAHNSFGQFGLSLSWLGIHRARQRGLTAA